MSRQITLTAACLLSLALLVGCGDSGGDKRAAQKAPAVEPLNLALFISPGEAPGQAVALVRIYSQAAQQKALDNRQRPKDRQQETRPYSLAGGEQLWIKSLAFEVQPPAGGQGFALSPAQDGACRAMRYPKSAELSVGPARGYAAVYQLQAPDKLVPGSRIKAMLQVQGRGIVSPVRVMPAPSRDNQEAALRKARTSRWLGDSQGMLAAGQELIKKDPALMAGYWYQALALEKMGQDQPALASYEQAWDKWRQLVKNNPYAEPPMRLARRIARLRAKLKVPPPNPEDPR